MFSTTVKIPGTEDQGKLYIVINLHCTNQAVVEVDSLVRHRPEQCMFTHSTFIVCETLFLLTILFKCVTLSVLSACKIWCLTMCWFSTSDACECDEDKSTEASTCDCTEEYKPCNETLPEWLCSLDRVSGTSILLISSFRKSKRIAMIEIFVYRLITKEMNITSRHSKTRNATVILYNANVWRHTLYWIVFNINRSWKSDHSARQQWHSLQVQQRLY